MASYKEIANHFGMYGTLIKLKVAIFKCRI